MTPTWAGGAQPAGPQRALHQAWPAYAETHLSVIFTVVLLYTDLWETEKVVKKVHLINTFQDIHLYMNYFMAALGKSLFLW